MRHTTLRTLFYHRLLAVTSYLHGLAPAGISRLSRRSPLSASSLPSTSSKLPSTSAAVRCSGGDQGFLLSINKQCTFFLLLSAAPVVLLVWSVSPESALSRVIYCSPAVARLCSRDLTAGSSSDSSSSIRMARLRIRPGFCFLVLDSRDPSSLSASASLYSVLMPCNTCCSPTSSL